MTFAETEMRRLGVTPDKVARAEALFDKTEPRSLSSRTLPFHLWSDASQRYFLTAANG